MSSNPLPTISAFIVCCNEERNIRRCLESVQWCDEIVVVDSGSTDNTVAIAREFTEKVFFKPWGGFVAQKRFGLESTTGTWVLNLDADEVVTRELKDEIRRNVGQADSKSINGFELLRVVFYLNRWWRKGGWYPEFRLRVVRKSQASWGGEDPHEKAEVAGRVVRLSSELQHYTYSGISDQINSLNNHSTVAAQSMFKRGKRFSITDLFFRPFGRFFKFYIVRKGFMEGFPGFVVGILEAFYVFLKYVKLWELERKN